MKSPLIAMLVSVVALACSSRGDGSPASTPPSRVFVVSFAEYDGVTEAEPPRFMVEPAPSAAERTLLLSRVRLRTFPELVAVPATTEVQTTEKGALIVSVRPTEQLAERWYSLQFEPLELPFRWPSWLQKQVSEDGRLVYRFRPAGAALITHVLVCAESSATGDTLVAKFSELIEASTVRGRIEVRRDDLIAECELNVASGSNVALRCPKLLGGNALKLVVAAGLKTERGAEVAERTLEMATSRFQDLGDGCHEFDALDLTLPSP